MTFDVRLVAYEPNGARLAPLPDTLDLAAGLPLGDVSSLTLTHSDLMRGSAFLGRPLGQGLEVALEVTTGAGWVEPAGCRFVRLEQSRAVTDDHLVRKVTLPSYAWMLRKMRLLSLANLNTDGKRPFLSATAGTILRTLIQESQARGTVTGLGIDFTTAADSSGAAWSKIITIYYAPGIDVWTVLDNLAAQGVVDWTMQGRTLRVFNPDSALAVDRSTGGNPVTLHLGRDVIDAPQSESLTDVVSTVLVRGEGSLAITETNAAAPSPWGAWEGYIEQGGVSDEGTARTLVQGELERGSRVRGEYTRDLTLDSATWLPMVHYAPGDYILAPGGDGGRERLRVRQVTLTRDSNGIASGNVVLNDRMVEAEIRRAKRTAGIVGGSSSGGSGARPAPEGPDKRTPAAPLGLVVDSNAYLNSAGNARGRIEAVWAAVATATDGSALEVAGYEVATRRNVTGAPWSMATKVTDPSATLSPLDVGASIQVRVRAVGRYATTPGAWSSTVTLTVASDTTPPPVPTGLTLTTRLGVIVATWAGTPAMPIDFDRVEVAMGATTTPTTVIDSLRSAGSLPIAGQPYGETRWVRLRSVDRSGNVSAWGAVASIATKALVDADLIATTIAAQIDEVRGEAQGAVTIAEGKLTTSTAAPTVADGSGKPAGAMWYQRGATGAITGMWEWSGTAWASRSMGPDAIASGAITSAKIATAVNDQIAKGIADAKAADDKAVAAAAAADQALLAAENLWPWTSQWWSGANIAQSAAQMVYDGLGGATANNNNRIGTPAKPVPARTYRLIVTVSNATTTQARLQLGGYRTLGQTYVSSIWPTGNTRPIPAGADRMVTTQDVVVNYPTGTDSFQPIGYCLDGVALTIHEIRVIDVTDLLALEAIARDAATTATTADARTTVSTVAPVAADGAGKPTDAMWYRYAGATLLGSWRWTGSAWIQVAWGSDALASGAVTAAKIADNAVTVGKIVDGAVVEAKLAPNAVTSDKIAALAVNAAKIAANAVTTAKVAPGAITATEITDGSITTPKILAGAVVADSIATNAVTTAKINAGAVTATEIATNAITAVKISANAVTTAKIAANAVTAVEIAAGAVTAGKVAANSITATEMLAGTITAASGILANASVGNAQIADAAITNAKIANLDAGKINAGVLDAARIGANTITADKMLVGSGANLIPDADWRGSPLSTTWTGTLSPFSVIADPTGRYLRADATVGTGWRELRQSVLTPVTAGQVIRARARYRTVGTINGQGIRLALYAVDHAGVRYTSGLPQAILPAAADWTETTISWTVPEGVAAVSIFYSIGGTATTGRAEFKDAEMKVADAASLIVDGGILARHIAANSVTATQMLAGTITAASGIIADAAIGTAKIADAAITDAKVANLSAGKITAGTLDADRIGANAIGADKIAANAVTAAKIAALAVESDKIAANAITADKISAGAITAVKIDSDAIDTAKLAAGAITAKHTITGATIQTTAVTNRGVKITGSGLYAYDNSGALTASITGTSGSLSGYTITGGYIRTAESGARIILTKGSEDLPQLWMLDAAGNSRINMGFLVGGEPALSMGDGNRTRLTLTSSGALYAWAPNGYESFRLTTQDDGAHARAWIEGPNRGLRAGMMLGQGTVDGTTSSLVEVTGGFTGPDASYMRVTGGGSWWLGSSTRGRVSMDNSSGEILIYPRSNLFSLYNLPTTTSTGQPITMIVSGAGRPSIYRNTSVRATKMHITDVGVDPARVLDLDVRDWYDKTEWERRAEALEASANASENGVMSDQDVLLRAESDGLRRIPGLVAEEVEEAGLSEFCSYDESGNLVGVMYDRVALLLIPLVRDLTARLNALEGATQ